MLRALWTAEHGVRSTQHGNKKMKKLIIILFLGLIRVAGIFAQDPQFSQFYATPLYLGPSMAGAYENPRLIVNYRDQWPKLPGRYVTYSISADNFFPKIRSGFGFIFMQDNAGKGKLVTTLANLCYSYRIVINHTFFLQPGLALQYYSRDINFNTLRFADQYMGNTLLPSSLETPVNNRPGHLDISSSILGFGNNYWVGFSLDHLLKLNNNFADNPAYLPLRLSFYGGYKIKFKERVIHKIEQSMFLAYQLRVQTNMYHLDLGAYYKKSPMIIGLWYRGIPLINSIKSQGTVILLAGFELGKVSFSYSYDFNVSALISTTGGAHELTFTYRFTQLSKMKKKMGAVPCPRF